MYKIIYSYKRGGTNKTEIFNKDESRNINQEAKLKKKKMDLKKIENSDIYIVLTESTEYKKYQYEIFGETQDDVDIRKVYLVLKNKDKEKEEKEIEIVLNHNDVEEDTSKFYNFYNIINLNNFNNGDVEFDLNFWKSVFSTRVNIYTNSEFFIRAKYNGKKYESDKFDLKKKIESNKIKIGNFEHLLQKNKQEDEQEDDSQDEKVKLREHPKYAAVFKLKEMTGSEGMAKQRAIMLGLNPDILDLNPDTEVPSTDELDYNAIKNNKVLDSSTSNDSQKSVDYQNLDLDELVNNLEESKNFKLFNILKSKYPTSIDSQKSVDYESLDLNELVNNLGKNKKLKLFNMLNKDNSTSSSSIDHRNSNLNFKLNDNFLNFIIR